MTQGRIGTPLLMFSEFICTRQWAHNIITLKSPSLPWYFPSLYQPVFFKPVNVTQTRDEKQTCC